jgi:tetratricopeptide (TPR) repeat protein
MSEIARHLEKAEKYLQKGRQAAALLEYFEVLREDPAHETASQTADLALSLGHRTEAASILRQILERQLVARSEMALITYRRLLKVAAVAPDQTEQVARLIERTNRKESIELYGKAVRGYAEAGHRTDALVAMEALVLLDPTAQRLCQLADLAADAHEVGRAVAALLRAAALLAPEDLDNATALYERAHNLDPSDAKAALAYGRALLVNVTPDKARRAVTVFAPYTTGPDAAPETRGSYGRALLAADRVAEAEPWP